MNSFEALLDELLILLKRVEVGVGAEPNLQSQTPASGCSMISKIAWDRVDLGRSGRCALRVDVPIWYAKRKLKVTDKERKELAECRYLNWHEAWQSPMHS
jgi:hypothetical protein